MPAKAEVLRFIQDQPGRVSAREVARAFNLKGAARMAGALDLGEEIHALEGEVGTCGAASMDAARLDGLEAGYDRIADKIEHHERVRNAARADEAMRERCALPGLALPPSAPLNERMRTWRQQHGHQIRPL